MAGNQREIQRQEKRNKKDRRNKIIIWVAIAVVVLVLAIMKISEININSVKSRFTDANGNFTIAQGVVEDNFPYNLDSSKNVVVRNVNDKIGALTPSSFAVVNSKNAEAEYTFDHGYSNPILEDSGVYTLLYDQGTKSMRLDTTSDNVYEHDVENNIFCADVAKNGSVAYATTSSEKKCDIIVSDKSLKEKLKTSISYGYVVDIAINDSASKIAFVAVNSENAQLKTKLYTYNIGSSEPKAEIDLPLGNVVDIEYSSNNLYVIGDTYLGVVSGQKKYEPVFDSGKINTIIFTYTPSDELLLVYNGYNNSTDNILIKVKPNGKIRKEATVKGNVKSISASSSSVSVLTNTEIINYSLSKLKEKSRIPVDDTVKSICRMGSGVYAHRQSLIERAE